MILRILKNKNKKAKALLAVLFLVLGINFSQAGLVYAQQANSQQEAFDAANAAAANGTLNLKSGNNTSATAGTSEYKEKGALDTATGQKVYPQGSEKTETCSFGDFKCYFKLLLIGVFNAVGFIFAIAATLFSWVVEPANISGDNGMLNKQAVKDVWIMVRDLLNMSFIIVLLFSAFGTIFRDDKWNIKKVWLNILINALLVNFSYPIARIIIDISNVAFYYLLNNLFIADGATAVSGSSIFAGFGDSSRLGKILMPDGFTQYDIAYIIASIVFVFILGMTLFIIAALFMVRLVGLTMLVMFSPIGFVGYAIPSMSGYADKWWKNLMNYSFFAPIMIFIMAISLRIMQAVSSENFKSMVSKASPNSPANMVEWVASAAFFTIPIIILWTGIGVAKSSGVEFANKIVDTAKKGGKKIAMKFSGAEYLKKNYDAYSAARKKRAEEIGKKRWGGNIGDKANDIQDKALAKLGSERAQKRYDKRREASNKDDIKNKAEGIEGKNSAVLKQEIYDAMNNANMTDKEKMDFAVNAKLALSRGAKHESEIEKDIKDDIRNNRVNYADLDTAGIDAENAKMYFDQHNDTKPRALHPGATEDEHREHQTKMAEWMATRTQLKDDMEKTKKKFEAEEKKVLQEKKTEHLDKLRKAIQAGEDIGKIKSRN